MAEALKDMIHSILNFIREKREKSYIQNLIRNGLKLGKNVHIVDHCFWDVAHCYLIQIDDNCVIAPKVNFIAHDASGRSHVGYTKIGKIHINSGCFIGFGSTLLPGVTVGENSIVAACSVVTKSFPGGVVIAGNPAKIIMTIDEYKSRALASIEREGVKLFGSDYHIWNLNAEKMQEVIDAATNGVAYMK